MHPITVLLSLLLSLYGWVVFFYVLVNLLVYFDVLKTDQPFVIRARKLLADAVEPVLAHIRKYVKPYNGVDWSPAILLIAIYFLQYCLNYYF